MFFNTCRRLRLLWSWPFTWPCTALPWARTQLQQSVSVLRSNSLQALSSRSFYTGSTCLLVGISLSARSVSNDLLLEKAWHRCWCVAKQVIQSRDSAYRSKASTVLLAQAATHYQPGARAPTNSQLARTLSNCAYGCLHLCSTLLPSGQSCTLQKA